MSNVSPIPSRILALPAGAAGAQGQVGSSSSPDMAHLGVSADEATTTLGVTGPAGDTTQMNMAQAIAAIAQLSPDQQAELQHRMYDAGLYPPSYYAGKVRPKFGMFSTEDYLVYVAVLRGASLRQIPTNQFLQEATTNLEANGGLAANDPKVPSVVTGGGVYHRSLSNPADVATIVDAVTQKIAGRAATGDEKDAILKLIQGSETANFDASTAAAESQRQDLHLNRVAARNERYPSAAAGPGGGATFGGMVAPFANFDLSKQFRQDDQGVDLQTDVNTPVLAAADGHIVIKHDAGGFGPNYAVLVFDTPINGQTGVYYGHVAPDVKDGQRVTAGQAIGHTQPGGPNAGNAEQDGWLEFGFVGSNLLPTKDGKAMHAALSQSAAAPTDGTAQAAGGGKTTYQPDEVIPDAVLVDALRQAGFNSDQIPLMIAIAHAESGGAAKLNDNADTGDYSVGPWQINYKGGMRAERTAKYGTPEQLRVDPYASARAAWDISKHGTDPRAWTTYNEGKHLQFMALGQAALAGQPPPATPGAPGSAGTADTADSITPAQVVTTTAPGNVANVADQAFRFRNPIEAGAGDSTGAYSMLLSSIKGAGRV